MTTPPDTLARALQRHGMTATSLARLLGVSRETVQRWKGGQLPLEGTALLCVTVLAQSDASLALLQASARALARLPKAIGRPKGKRDTAPRKQAAQTAPRVRPQRPVAAVSDVPLYPHTPAAPYALLAPISENRDDAIL